MMMIILHKIVIISQAQRWSVSKGFLALWSALAAAGASGRVAWTPGDTGRGPVPAVAALSPRKVSPRSGQCRMLAQGGGGTLQSLLHIKQIFSLFPQCWSSFSSVLPCPCHPVPPPAPWLCSSFFSSPKLCLFVFVVFCPGFFGPFLQFSGSFWNFNPALKCICRSCQAAHRWGFNHCSSPPSSSLRNGLEQAEQGRPLHLPSGLGFTADPWKPEGNSGQFFPAWRCVLASCADQENDCKVSNKEIDSGKAGMLRQIPITPRVDRDPSVGWGRTGRAPRGTAGWGQCRGDLWGPFTPNRKRVKSPEQHQCHTWGSSSMECLSLDFLQ